jgi:hypothetical protein
MSDNPTFLVFDEIVRDHPNDDAILVRIDGREIWIPRSLIKNDYENDELAEVPWWWVKQNGLEAYASVDDDI